MQRKMTNKIAAEKLFSDLTSGSGTLVLARLNEIDSGMPSNSSAAILKKAYDQEKDSVLKFQMKKSLRYLAGKFKNIKFNVEIENFKKLLLNPSRIEDTALALLALTPANAFLVADIIRENHWQYFVPEILPSFCHFFKAYGGVEDVQTLLELTRHPNPIVLTSAINTLEVIDPTNLQGIVEPLLTSSTYDTRAQAIEVLYKWNKKEAIKHFKELLLSDSKEGKALAIHHAEYFHYKEIEPQLLEVLTRELDSTLLLSLSRIFVKNAHKELPTEIFNKTLNLAGEQERLTKGILLAVIRELSRKMLLDCTVQDYLEKLKQDREKHLKKMAEKPIEPPALTPPAPLPEGAASAVTAATEVPEESEVAQTSGQEAESATPATQVTDPETDVTKKVTKPEETEDLLKNLEGYGKLTEREKVKFLNKITPEFFAEKREILQGLMGEATRKELASHIKLLSRFGNDDDTDKIRDLCRANNPDVVCACIHALAKRDIEFLCLYLPQFLQNRNGKIRMTATRVFAKIDSERILSLITGMISSPNTKLRNLGVSTSMLVDFNLIKEPLINALAKEKSFELVEKITTVLASNPDKDMLYEVYKLRLTDNTAEAKSFEYILENIADKLSITLNKEQSAEELLEEVEARVKKEKTQLKEKRMETLKQETKGAKAQKASETVEGPPVSKEESARNLRGKTTVIILILAAVAWGALLAYGLLWLLGG